MSELGPSSFEQPRSIDSPGHNADTPFGHQELYGRKAPPAPPKNPVQHELGRKTEPAPPKNPLERNLGRKPDYGHPSDLNEGYPRGDGHEDWDHHDKLGEATEKVREAMSKINEVDIAIAEQTGAAGIELTSATDAFLVADAERRSRTGDPHADEAVETTLLAGALEKTGFRQGDPTDTIVKLEQDGYEDVVTAGVEELAKEGATLPDGESAAEVVAEVIEESEQEQQEPISDELDTALQVYYKGGSPEDIQRITGIDPKEVTKYIRSLPPDERDRAIDTRAVALGKEEAGSAVYGTRIEDKELAHSAALAEAASRQPDAMHIAAEVIQQEQEAQMDPGREVIGNYEGNWFNLQQQRMSSHAFREKFQRFIEKHISSLDPGEPSSFLQKPEGFQLHYQSQLDQFDANLDRVSNSVGYGNATDVGGKSAGSLGHGKIGQPGTVYRDAIHQDGTPLLGRQKDIIAAHEAYHGMIDIKGSAINEVKSGFDWDTYNSLVDTTSMKQPNYLRNPDELTARMAQFKNYFGMQGGEPFTGDHLNYIRQHYLEDTGLDNGISTMLKMVTPATEKRFIELMNELPL